MKTESSKKPNNLDLGEWLEREDLIPDKKRDIQALLWPANIGLASSLEKTSKIDRIVVSGPKNPLVYKELSNAIGTTCIHHNLSKKFKDSDFNPENAFDLEYGWAVASDITRDYENSFESHIEGLDRLAKTSYKHLDNRSTAVYNLEDIGNSYVNPVAEQFDSVKKAEEAYAEAFQDVLDNYFEEVNIYSDHDMEHRNTHVVGKDPV